MMIRCCYCTRYAKCLQLGEKLFPCPEYKCRKFNEKHGKGTPNYEDVSLVLRKEIPFLNVDGIRQERSVEGLKNYLRFSRKEGISVYREDFNEATIRFADINKISLFPRNMKKFSKMFYWFLGYKEDWGRTEENYYLNGKEIWDRLNRKRIVAHPDREEVKDCLWIYQLNNIKRLLEKRKRYVY